MEENIKALIELIQQSPLDQTVKDILVRDLQSEGLTDFLKEQIKAYCLEGIEKLDKKIEETDKLLNTNPS
ncbi:MAG: hypothetical protein M1400_01235 [Patescibacteria group bacterium]|nr:hypothetical protein [Patescibacteria group bacterium]